MQSTSLWACKAEEKRSITDWRALAPIFARKAGRVEAKNPLKSCWSTASYEGIRVAITGGPSAILRVRRFSLFTCQVGTSASGTMWASVVSIGMMPMSARSNLRNPVVADPTLAGYRIYYGIASKTYLQPVGQGLVVGNVTTYTLSGLDPATTYYFAVTAYDQSGNESVLSNEAVKTLPAP